MLYIDGDNTNCCLDNLVAKIIVNDRMKYSPCDLVPPPHIWTKAKLWNGDVLPNYYCSIDGKIALVRGDSIQPRKISAGSNCYMLHIQGMRLDARKLIWRAFTDENPEYSECHYNVHIISKTREDVLAFSNLELYIESSIFDKWTKEEVNWPWTRSKQGNVPKELKTKKQRVASKRAQRKVQAKMVGKKRTSKAIKK